MAYRERCMDVSSRRCSSGPRNKANREEMAWNVSKHTLGDFQVLFAYFNHRLHVNSNVSVDECALINFSSVFIHLLQMERYYITPYT